MEDNLQKYKTSIVGKCCFQLGFHRSRIVKLKINTFDVNFQIVSGTKDIYRLQLFAMAALDITTDKRFIPIVFLSHDPYWPIIMM